ncbi:hypothetical protein [Cellvibrio polysaccharolyticus]|nr:hypothetical protein [Cellvibrio polysaccharolyticus]
MSQQLPDDHKQQAIAILRVMQPNTGLMTMPEPLLYYNSGFPERV